MILHNGISVRRMLKDSRGFIFVVLAWTAIVVMVDDFVTVDLSPPVTVLGLTVAFFLGFKNTSAFARWWEARNIWGEVVNSSRDWGNVISNLVGKDGTPVDEEIRRTLIERHIAWLNMLAYQLRTSSRVSRGRKPWMFGHEWQLDRLELHQTTESWRAKQLDEDLPLLEDKDNKAVFLLKRQGEMVSSLAQTGIIEPYWQVALMERLARLADAQGRCERIKNTPFPRQIAEVGRIFSWIFIFLLPFAFHDQRDIAWDFNLTFLLSAFHDWLSLAPIGGLVCWVFYVTEQVSASMEDPFDGGVTDVPISALCRNIEIDLRQMTGWGMVPSPTQPIERALY
ncbi:MAG: bestrophin family protein [Paracoccaceae bacterium]